MHYNVSGPEFREIWPFSVGYWNETVSNFVADAPTVWVENAFATSFEKAGYEITRVDSVAAANATTDPLAKAIPDINSRLIAASGG